MKSKMDLRVGSSFREYGGDGVVRRIDYMSKTHSVWASCRKLTHDVPTPWNAIIPTDDPVDCLRCLAEGA